jgi:hypothetical protein
MNEERLAELERALEDLFTHDWIRDNGFGGQTEAHLNQHDVVDDLMYTLAHEIGLPDHDTRYEKYSAKQLITALRAERARADAAENQLAKRLHTRGFLRGSAATEETSG